MKWKKSIFIISVLVLALIIAGFFLLNSSVMTSVIMICIIFFMCYKIKEDDTMHNNRKILYIFVLYLSLIAYFSIIYSITGTQDYYFEENNQNITRLSFGNAIYFSTVTVATVGYGDIIPHGYFRGVVVAEIILGTVLFGLLLYYITK